MRGLSATSNSTFIDSDDDEKRAGQFQRQNKTLALSRGGGGTRPAAGCRLQAATAAADTWLQPGATLQFVRHSSQVLPAFTAR